MFFWVLTTSIDFYIQYDLLRLGKETVLGTNTKKSHPELREGEIFLGNVVPRDYRETWQFRELDSFRLGRIAYDMFGKERPGLMPAFAKAEEFFKKERGRKDIVS